MNSNIQFTSDSIVDQLRGMLTDQFWTVIALVALGMVFGIASAGAARLFKYRLDDALSARMYHENALALKRIAFVSGALWTFAVLLFFITGDVFVKGLMSLCLAAIAGLGTPHMYDLLKWVAYTLAPSVGRWLLEFIKARISTMFGGKPKS